MRQLLFGRLGTRWGWPAVKAYSSRPRCTMTHEVQVTFAPAAPFRPPPPPCCQLSAAVACH